MTGAVKRILLVTLITCRVWAGSPQLGCLMRHIAVKEGYFRAGTLPARLNNPGALVYTGQPGATRGPRGFAAFGRTLDGWLALQRDLEAKMARHQPLGRAWQYMKEGVCSGFRQERCCTRAYSSRDSKHSFTGHP